MFKQRSDARRRIAADDALKPPAQRDSAAFWRRRVFRNTYTRDGRTLRVRRWSVKIQHRARRQTFSLTAVSRAEAAREAQSLCHIIRTEGWEAARQAPGLGALASARRASGTGRGGWSKSDPRYWRERLIHSKYRDARLLPIKEFTVRIEDGGTYRYFPLGTDDEERAAAEALKIYRRILTKGWEAAFRQFPREITVAIFWSTSPVACTYTTLFTFPNRSSPGLLPPAGQVRTRKKVVVLEADAEVRRTLVFWLGRQPGFECARAFKSAEETQNIIMQELPDMVLVNRALPEMPVIEFLERLKGRRPDLPAFMYGVYPDSDQIFITLSGVTAGYIFRRRKPAELFEPIRGAFRQRVLSAKEVLRQIREYFQSLFRFTLGGDETPGLAALTAREQEILNYVSKGFLDKEIAGALSISIWTVHNHLKHIYEKLGVHNRTEAVLKYLQK